MAVTRRGKTFISIVALFVLVAGIVIVRNFGGRGVVNDPNAPDVSAGVTTGSTVSPLSNTCPLTGEAPASGEDMPDRPALVIKVENSIEARPQYGLDMADVIYEQPVEGGITRFIAIFQCQDARRVEPVRSGRTSDPPILVQYGSPLFAYADATPDVIKAVERRDQIHDVNWQKVPDAYHHDGAREAPHDVYTSTKELWDQAKRSDDAPSPVFLYGEPPADLAAKPGRKVNLVFSETYADVWWKYQEGVYKRYHGNEPHLLAGQDQIQADNVLVQVVKLDFTGRKDPAGNPIPEVISVGSGKAYLYRDGKVYVGKWTRKAESQNTLFATAGGKEFVLKAGTTWVELYPKAAAKVKA